MSSSASTIWLQPFTGAPRINASWCDDHHEDLASRAGCGGSTAEGGPNLTPLAVVRPCVIGVGPAGHLYMRSSSRKMQHVIVLSVTQHIAKSRRRERCSSSGFSLKLTHQQVEELKTDAD
ncbi:hypothetical protein EJB05_47223 [Eragrostis curvula]|uniref:Uncharacterized protein n=1 Tax=Eragrostis curvula TaxID=38414 RepID=A0A5J9T6Z0_9POAL|nr:hypothetical protein EJB05_47223 [Eragrostis curvula]